MKKHLSALANATKARLKAFGKDQSGSVIQMVGYSVIPIFLCAGVAIDTTRVNYTHQKFASSLDAAAIAAAAAPVGTSTDNMKVLARRFVDQNFKDSDKITITSFNLTNTATTVKVSGTARVQTSIMFVAQTEGITQANTSYVDISLSSEVLKAGENIEVALMLDNTGSMASSMTSLKAAAKDFVAKVMPAATSTYSAKISLVPYSMGVNVGTLADSVRGTPIAGTSTTPGYTNFKFNDARDGSQKTFAITNCVSERTGSQKYTDAPATTYPVGRVYANANNPCLNSQLMPLTDSKSAMNTAIDAMQAQGSSAGQVGIAWGWYTLSPDFGLWSGISVPASYTAPKTRKVAILMSDGEYNSAYCKGVISGKPYNNSWSGNDFDHINCAPDNDPTYNAATYPPLPFGSTPAQTTIYNTTAKEKSVYVQSKALCAAMKAKGIEIYTIEFLLDSSYPDRVDVLASCATDASHRVTASSNSELQTAFAKIASTLTDMRVAK
jgi:Flp pilus assembly protein TadG